MFQATQWHEPAPTAPRTIALVSKTFFMVIFRDVFAFRGQRKRVSGPMMATSRLHRKIHRAGLSRLQKIC